MAGHEHDRSRQIFSRQLIYPAILTENVPLHSVVNLWKQLLHPSPELSKFSVIVGILGGDSLRRCTNRLKFFQQNAKSGNSADRLSRTDRYFMIFGKAAGVVEPRQRTLNDPPLGQDLPFRLDAYRNIDAKPQRTGNVLLKSFTVTRVSTKLLNRRVFLKCFSCSQDSRFRIMYIGSMNYHRQQITHSIHYDVPFALFCFFPPSIPHPSAAEVVFTLCESIIVLHGSLPRARFGLRRNKSWPLLCMVENRGSDLSIFSHYLRNIAPHSPVPVFPTYSCFLPRETSAL